MLVLGHKILKIFGHFVFISILLNSCVYSSNTARSRRFSLDDLDHEIVGFQAGVPVASSAVQILDDWCGNLTKHLNTTVEKFVSKTPLVSFPTKLQTSSFPFHNNLKGYFSLHLNWYVELIGFFVQLAGGPLETWRIINAVIARFLNFSGKYYIQLFIGQF